MYIDTHCHLHMLDVSHCENGVADVVSQAHQADVKQLLCVSVALADGDVIKAYCDQFEHVYGSIGIHPNEPSDQNIQSDTLVKLADDPKIKAIGETGLDYYRTEEQQPWQQQRFNQHIRAAREINKPLIVHTRAARQDTIAIMQQENAAEVGGVMHCFTEDYEMASKALDLNFYISFSGIITFKNAKELQEVVKQVPLERCLIETDCPYLAPVPHRGKPNVPAYVVHVAEKIAELKQISIEEVAHQTTANAQQLFGLDKIHG